MAVSYRRNRNYTNQFNWTYELNQELFECYKKAKSDPRIGYMNRMKVLWDNLHPEYASFSAKKLRDQASRVEKKRVVIATEFDNNNNNNNNNQNDINSRSNNNHYENETNLITFLN